LAEKEFWSLPLEFRQDARLAPFTAVGAQKQL
jgi:hypothetical protein